MFCSKCGLANQESARFCAKCGTNLSSAPDSGGSHQLVYAGGPGAGTGTIREPLATDRLGHPQKNPTVATLLSLAIIGLGQLYNGDLKKGLVLFFGAAILTIPTAGVALLAFWIWAGLDAYKVASHQWKRW